MFTEYFQDYDIICLQEVFAIVTSELRETVMQYA